MNDRMEQNFLLLNLFNQSLITQIEFISFLLHQPLLPLLRPGIEQDRIIAFSGGEQMQFSRATIPGLDDGKSDSFALQREQSFEKGDQLTGRFACTQVGNAVGVDGPSPADQIPMMINE